MRIMPAINRSRFRVRYLHHFVVMFALAIGLGVFAHLKNRRLAAHGGSQASSGPGPDQKSPHGPAAIDQLKATGQYESLSQAMTAARYKIEEDSNRPGSLKASNPANGFAMSFDPDGLKLRTRSDDVNMELAWRVRSIGYGDEQSVVPQANPVAKGQCVEIKHGSNLIEWFENRPEGVEQGFTVTDRPKAETNAGTLRLVLEFDGA